MSKARKAKAFTVRLYRVNGMLEIPIMAATPAEARRQACEEAAAGVKQQPGGPTMFFQDDRTIHFIAVVAGAEARRQYPHEGGQTL